MIVDCADVTAVGGELELGSSLAAGSAFNCGGFEFRCDVTGAIDAIEVDGGKASAAEGAFAGVVDGAVSAFDDSDEDVGSGFDSDDVVVEAVSWEGFVSVGAVALCEVGGAEVEFGAPAYTSW